LGDGNDGYALFIEPAVVGGWDSAAVTVSPVDGDGDDGEVFRFRVLVDNYAPDASDIEFTDDTRLAFALVDQEFVTSGTFSPTESITAECAPPEAFIFCADSTVGDESAFEAGDGGQWVVVTVPADDVIDAAGGPFVAWAWVDESVSGYHSALKNTLRATAPAPVLDALDYHATPLVVPDGEGGTPLPSECDADGPLTQGCAEGVVGMACDSLSDVGADCPSPAGDDEFAVSGTVVDAANGDGINGATVTAIPVGPGVLELDDSWSTDTKRDTTAAVDGWFALTLPEGPWLLSVTHDTYLPGVHPILVNANQEPVTIPLVADPVQAVLACADLEDDAECPGQVQEAGEVASGIAAAGVALAEAISGCLLGVGEGVVWRVCGGRWVTRCGSCCRAGAVGTIPCVVWWTRSSGRPGAAGWCGR
jgi:hypothetical protein